MNDAKISPTYSDEYLVSLSPFELTDILIEGCDRVPRNVIDEYARRGDEMTEHLRSLHEIDYLWDPEGSDGVWWLRLHAPTILGLIKRGCCSLNCCAVCHWKMRISKTGRLLAGAV